MHSLRRQVVSFGLIGVINTLVDIGSFSLMVMLGVPYLPATFVSTSLGLLTSFTLNRRYTFAAPGSLVRFLVVTLIGLWVLQPLIIGGITALTSHSHMATIAAKVVATAVTMVWNFIWYRHVVFREQDI